MRTKILKFLFRDFGVSFGFGGGYEVYLISIFRFWLYNISSSFYAYIRRCYR
jgi:hypothetical protein